MLKALQAYAGAATLSTGSPVSLGAATSIAADSFFSPGSGAVLHSAGFVGHGPFWTCGSPRRCSRAGAACEKGFKEGGGGGPTQSSGADKLGGADQHKGLADRLGGAAKAFLAAAIDIPLDSPPPEDELTTYLETKEQGFQWRDFLSEAASKSCANALFASYDVEAEPPPYMRPPHSVPSVPVPLEAAELQAMVSMPGPPAFSVAAAAEVEAVVQAALAEATTAAAEALRRVSADAMPQFGPALRAGAAPMPRVERRALPTPHVVAPHGSGWTPIALQRLGWPSQPPGVAAAALDPGAPPQPGTPAAAARRLRGPCAQGTQLPSLLLQMPHRVDPAPGNWIGEPSADEGMWHSDATPNSKGARADAGRA